MVVCFREFSFRRLDDDHISVKKLEKFSLFLFPTSSQRFRMSSRITCRDQFYVIQYERRFRQGSRWFSIIGMRWLWKYPTIWRIKIYFQPCFKNFRFHTLIWVFIRSSDTFLMFTRIHWHFLKVISTFLILNLSHFNGEQRISVFPNSNSFETGFIWQDHGTRFACFADFPPSAL